MRCVVVVVTRPDHARMFMMDVMKDRRWQLQKMNLSQRVAECINSDKDTVRVIGKVIDHPTEVAIQMAGLCPDEIVYHPLVPASIQRLCTTYLRSNAQLVG